MACSRPARETQIIAAGFGWPEQIRLTLPPPVYLAGALDLLWTTAATRKSDA